MPNSSTSSKLLVGIRNPFFCFFSTPSKSRRIPVGLGLVDVLVDEDSTNAGAELTRRIVVFGSYQLKIQTPNSTCTAESPGGSKVLAGSYCGRPPPPEMEQSEEYTCVILHGPNPRTTHIFDNCVIESSNYSLPDDDDGRRASAADHFSSFGCRCMYRGERAFCSDACRAEEIWSGEEKEKHSAAGNL